MIRNVALWSNHVEVSTETFKVFSHYTECLKCLNCACFILLNRPFLQSFSEAIFTLLKISCHFEFYEKRLQKSRKINGKLRKGSCNFLCWINFSHLHQKSNKNYTVKTLWVQETFAFSKMRIWSIKKVGPWNMFFHEYLEGFYSLMGCKREF